MNLRSVSKEYANKEYKEIVNHFICMKRKEQDLFLKDKSSREKMISALVYLKEKATSEPEKWRNFYFTLTENLLFYRDPNHTNDDRLKNAIEELIAYYQIKDRKKYEKFFRRLANYELMGSSLEKYIPLIEKHLSLLEEKFKKGVKDSFYGRMLKLRSRWPGKFLKNSRTFAGQPPRDTQYLLNNKNRKDNEQTKKPPKRPRLENSQPNANRPGSLLSNSLFAPPPVPACPIGDKMAISHINLKHQFANKWYCDGNLAIVDSGMLTPDSVWKSIQNRLNYVDSNLSECIQYASSEKDALRIFLSRPLPSIYEDLKSVLLHIGFNPECHVEAAIQVTLSPDQRTAFLKSDIFQDASILSMVSKKLLYLWQQGKFYLKSLTFSYDEQSGLYVTTSFPLPVDKTLVDCLQDLNMNMVITPAPTPKDSWIEKLMQPVDGDAILHQVYQNFFLEETTAPVPTRTRY